MTKCKECPFFKKAELDGTCKLNGYQFDGETDCLYEERVLFNLNAKGAEKVIHYYQKWRKGANIPQPSPKLIGKALDTSIVALRNMKRNQKKKK